jgi:outer membrane protein assembly factor BamB
MLKPNRLLTGATAFGVAVMVGTIGAQVGRGTTEWPTAGADAQRTFWIRTDPKISVASMSQPGFERQWRAKLDNQTRAGNGLTHGITANGVTLFVPMSVVAGSSNNVYALDNDTGYLVWQRHFDAPLPSATAQCPGGMTTGATRIVPLVPPPITTPASGGGRAAQSYRSVIGEPGAGVPLEARGRGPAGPPAAAATPPPAAGTPPVPAPSTAPTPAAPAAAAPPAAVGTPPAPVPGAAPAATAPPAAAPGGAAAPAAAAGSGAAGPASPQRGAEPARGGGGGGFGGQPGAGIPGATAEQLGGGRGGLGRPSGVVYALSSDGILHVLGLPSGKDIQRPAEFVPANAKWSDTIAVNTTLYATTTGNCGGAPNAVWAIDLESDGKPVVSWKSNGGPIVGRLAFATDGTVLVAVGPGTPTGSGTINAIVSLDARTLQVKDWFSQPGVEFVTGPTVFKHNDREIVAAATKDGRVLLLNAASLGGANHATPLHASTAGNAASVAINALATWQELTITPAPAPAPAAPGATPPPGPAAPPAPPTVAYGTRWIVAPVATGLVAYKVVETGGSLALERGWAAQGLTAADTPIVVNGVVFALSTGRPSTPAGRGTPAVLHAYEGSTGKALWNSRTAMTTFASPGSFWSAMSQVYVGTNDGTLHTFGFLDERR